MNYNTFLYRTGASCLLQPTRYVRKPENVLQMQLPGSFGENPNRVDFQLNIDRHVCSDSSPSFPHQLKIHLSLECNELLSFCRFSDGLCLPQKFHLFQIAWLFAVAFDTFKALIELMLRCVAFHLCLFGIWRWEIRERLPHMYAVARLRILTHSVISIYRSVLSFGTLLINVFSSFPAHCSLFLFFSPFLLSSHAINFKKKKFK